MTVWVRIALYMLAGWLYGKGLIGAEVQTIVTTDPTVAGTIEALIAGVIGGLPVLWWRLAKRWGWST